jgi:NAD(P)-dependent dehydrogenase (short-subunit alcohol dehydrogenase family)
MERRFEGKVCLVTGAGSGIGAAIAERLAAEGGNLFLLDKNVSGAEATVGRIKKAGGTAEARALDVTDAPRVRSSFRIIADDAGSLDVLINVAGLSLLNDTRIVDITEETWDTVMAVNLRGPFVTCKYALPIMVQQGHGVIINMSSQAGFGGGTAYASSKAGLNALTRGIARQHANDGIRAVTIAPGAVQTPMLEVSKKKLGEGIVAPRPGVVKPVGDVEEVATLAAFLASDDAAYISGAIYTIDGGASGY